MRGRDRQLARYVRWAGQLVAKLRAEVRLSGIAAWRVLLRLINGNDFTFASSIGYYSLLSLLPCFMLLLAALGAVAADPAEHEAVLQLFLRCFPGQLVFVTAQLERLEDARI